MSTQKEIGRREFLKGSAGGLTLASALAGGAGMLTGCSRAELSTVTATETVRKPPDGEKVVIGMIGMGDLGRRHHLNQLLNNPEISTRVEVVAVCDADRNRRDEAAHMILRKTGRQPRVYEDYRQLVLQPGLDAAVIVTTDHWHALASIAAMEAGLDVYCEKPLTLTVEEGKAMVRTARRYGTVFQTGSQQRSDARFRQACELVRNGKIGRIRKIVTVLHPVRKGDWQPNRTPPAGMNWDLWQGQTPYVDYSPNRVFYEFRWFRMYSGGVMTDWGAHHNDIAQWALGMDQSGPVKVRPVSAEFAESGMHSVALDFVVSYTYANGTELECRTGGKNGVTFYGDKGEIFVSRSEITASDPDLLKGDTGPIKLYKSDNHHRNWLDCIRTRERCICDVEIGHRSVSVCHIGNIAMLLGRELSWDPEKEEFVNDDEANSMLSRPMRAPWHLAG